jgi:tetratricopeptide (TPR) repeat protein
MRSKTTNTLITLVFFISLINPFYLIGQDVSISKGHQLLQDKKFEEAKTFYLKLIEAGKQEKSLYYNLGIACFELENYPEAILYFEKGKQLAPGNEAIEHNLKLTNSKIDHAFIRVENFFLTRWWTVISNSMSLGVWTFLTIALLILLVVIFYLYHLGSNFFIHKWGMKIFVPLGILFLFTIATTNKNHHQTTNDDHAILLEENELFSGPDTRSTSIHALSPGYKVKIIDNLDNWLKVELINKEIGWIRDSGVARI